MDISNSTTVTTTSALLITFILVSFLVIFVLPFLYQHWKDRHLFAHQPYAGYQLFGVKLFSKPNINNNYSKLPINDFTKHLLALHINQTNKNKILKRVFLGVTCLLAAVLVYYIWHHLHLTYGIYIPVDLPPIGNGLFILLTVALVSSFMFHIYQDDRHRTNLSILRGLERQYGVSEELTLDILSTIGTDSNTYN